MADSHIDENKRLKDFINNLMLVEKASHKTHFDYYVHLGDVFNRRKPTPLELKIFATHIARIKADKKIIIVGNHDNVGEHLSTIDWIDGTNNVIVVPSMVIKDGKIKIHLAHRTVTEAKLGPKEIHLKAISYKQLPYDVILLGHIHKPQIINKSKPLVMYPGSIERINFGERGEKKYYWILDIKKKNIKLTSKELPTRPMYYVIFDLDRKTTSVNDKPTNKYEIKGAILKIKFVGKKETIKKINYDKLTNKYKEAYSVDYQFEYTNGISEKKLTHTKKISDKEILKGYCKEYKVDKNANYIAERILDEYTRNK